MMIGFSFPICPTGIVWVMRVPCALTPAIVCVPRSSFFKLPFAISCCCRDSILPLSASFDGPFIPPNGPPICSAVFVSACRMKLVPATGSLMNTNDFGVPEAASGPNPDSAERCARHNLSAVHSFEAQQFNAVAHGRSHKVSAWPAAVHHLTGRWRRFLRSGQSGAPRENSTENHTHAYSAIHHSYSSSLPNCCEVFAAAIAASPFFNCAIHAPTVPFSSAPYAGLNLSYNAATPICVTSPRRSERAPLPINLYCGRRTACGNPSSPTSKSTWIHSPARSSLTGRPSAPSALRCMRTCRIAASSVSAAKAPGKNVKPLSSLSATSVSELPAPAEPRSSIPSGTSAEFLWFARVAELLSGKLFAAGTEFRWFAATSCRLRRQLCQLTTPTSKAVAASAHVAIAAESGCEPSEF